MRRLVYAVFLLPAFALALTGCRAVASPPAGEASAAPATLAVFAAASLTDAFHEIGLQFAAEHQGTDVVFNFAGSNQLAAQIGQDAPADVFAAANRAQMQVAIASDRIASGMPERAACKGLFSRTSLHRWLRQGMPRPPAVKLLRRAIDREHEEGQ